MAQLRLATKLLGVPVRLTAGTLALVPLVQMTSPMVAEVAVAVAQEADLVAPGALALQAAEVREEQAASAQVLTARMVQIVPREH